MKNIARNLAANLAAVAALGPSTLARITATAATVAALGIGLAESASAVTGEPREDAPIGQSCEASGITILGCVQANNVLNGLDLDVLSDVVETVDADVPVSDITAQLPIVSSWYPPEK